MRLLITLTIGSGLLLAGLSSTAQTLFTYGKHAVNKDEFLHVYQKNSTQKQTDFSRNSVEEYLNLYAIFKMKVKEAEVLQMDTISALKAELNNYKNQLAESYLFDKTIQNQLVTEAYDRMSKEVKVSHILIGLRPDADSTAAYRKADSLYQALAGEKADFPTLARQFSEDRSSATNGGSIGYILPLEYIYAFETAAYTTPEGEISKPFRTQFGYHILKVDDVRPYSGELRVAQILVTASPSREAEALQKVEEITSKIKSGADFSELVKQYSEDKFSINNGGELPPFKVGKMDPAFETAAFGLKKPGDISEPVRTEFGFHIIKLLGRDELKPLDSIKDQLARRVEQDARYEMARDAYKEKARQGFRYKSYPENTEALYQLVEADTSKVLDISDYQQLDKPLFEFKGKAYSQANFMDYALNLTQGNLIGNRAKVLGDLQKMYEDKILRELEQEKLAETNPEYRALTQEYRNGILLFELMDKRVWTRATVDSTGLADYYEQHKSQYQWDPGFQGIVYTSTNETGLRKLQAAIQQGTDIPDALEQAKTDKTPLSQHDGRFEYNRFPLPGDAYQRGKATPVFKNEEGTYSFILVGENYPEKSQKSFDEARGFVVADYQDYLEAAWNKELLSKYPLQVNDKTLNSIVKK